jgi:hypothetical protein
MWFEKWPVVCFFVLCGWVSRSNAVVFVRKSMFLFSGGRPEASKRNLKFQSTTWHQF